MPVRLPQGYVEQSSSAHIGPYTHYSYVQTAIIQGLEWVEKHKLINKRNWGYMNKMILLDLFT